MKLEQIKEDRVIYIEFTLDSSQNSLNFYGIYGKVLMRLLEARQLSLKMLANVTYGYTAAAFSGILEPPHKMIDALVDVGCIFM
jgi:hypothetical protein